MSFPVGSQLGSERRAVQQLVSTDRNAWQMPVWTPEVWIEDCLVEEIDDKSNTVGDWPSQVSNVLRGVVWEEVQLGVSEWQSANSHLEQEEEDDPGELHGLRVGCSGE